MNQRIQQEHMYWRAARNPFTALMFREKEQKLGQKYNLMGLDYYKGGLYQKIADKIYYPTTQTYVPEFDWKNRHDANISGSVYYDGDTLPCRSGWMTKARNQDSIGIGCGTCYVFAPAGAVEARLNLFYNFHDRDSFRHADVNISEQEVWRCAQYPGNCQPDYQLKSFKKLQSYTCQESDYPYNPYNLSACSIPSSPTLPKVKIDTFSRNQSAISENYLKFLLITKGPVSVLIPSFFDPFTSNIVSHYVVLTGYAENDTGDVVYRGAGTNDPDIVLDANSPLIGTTRWNFKNSMGTLYGTSGFSNDNLAVLFPQFNISDCFIPTERVFWEGHDPDTSVMCSDEDQDGYYWWGIGPKPSTCPVGSSDLEDCDDWNRNLGPYNTDSSLMSYKYYECKSNCQTYSDSITVTESFPLINSDFHLMRDLVIPAGLTLTINASVWIAPGAEIRVRPGGLLKLDSAAVLTSMCTELWQGIKVYGSSGTQNTTTQGKVLLTGQNNHKPVIEHAACAIQNVNGSGLPGSGGIVDATKAIFRNNETAISLSSYSNGFSLTKFRDCIFESDSLLIDSSRCEQLVHLSDLSNGNSVKFEGCKFHQVEGFADLIGIRAHNANFSCQNYLSGPSQIRTQFDSLRYGVYVTSDQAPGVPFRIDSCVFTNNFRGVFASAITSAHVLSNTFNIPLLGESNAPEYGFTAYGLYLDACRIYHVENNNFIADSYSDNRPPAGYVATCGTFINNSGPYENEIYRNTYEELHCAVAAYRENRNGLGEGLRIKCNTFINNGTDIGVYKGTFTLTPNMGIKFNQGFQCINSADSSAGNVFTATEYDNHTWDICNYGDTIKYYHHRQNSTTLKVKPDEGQITDRVNVYENFGSVFGNNICIPDLQDESQNEEEQMEMEFNFTIIQIDSISDIISSIRDGGATDSLALAILNSMPSDAVNLYADLVSKSPFLSDTIMKSAIDKEDVLPNAMIRDIMVANPHAAKDDSILEAIESRITPMPDSMYAEILEGKFINDAMDTLHSLLTQKLALYEIIFNNLMNLFLIDSLSLENNDRITALLESDFRLSSKYTLALHYLDNGNFIQGNNLVSSIPSIYSLNQIQASEYENFCLFYNCKQRAILNNASITFDSVQIHSLIDIIESDTVCNFKTTVLARNALLEGGLYVYCEPLVFDPSTYINSMLSKHRRTTKISDEFLNIWPNPSKEYVIVDYFVNPKTKHILLTIYDLNGNLCDLFRLTKKKDQKIILTNHLKDNAYIISISADDRMVQSKKLLIQK